MWTSKKGLQYSFRKYKELFCCVPPLEIINKSSGWQFIFGVIMQKFHNHLSAYCNSCDLTEHYTSAPLRGSVLALYSDSHRVFLANNFREHAFLLAALHFLATGDVTMSWHAVQTSDVLYALKLASTDNSLQAPSSASLSRAKMDQFAPLQRSQQRLVVNLGCKLL